MKICGTPKLMIQKTNKSIPCRNKYILENILLNIFKFYVLKYIIKFLQSRDNNKKQNSAFIISRNTCRKLAKHQVKNQNEGARTRAYGLKDTNRYMVALIPPKGERCIARYLIVGRVVGLWQYLGEDRGLFTRVRMSELRGGARSRFTLDADVFREYSSLLQDVYMCTFMFLCMQKLRWPCDR